MLNILWLKAKWSVIDMASALRVAVITNIIPAYRRDFYRRIFADPALEVTVYCQNHIPGMNLPSIHGEFGDRVVEVADLTFNHERLGWQHLPLLKLLKSHDIFFVYGNPRVFSNILISLLLKLLGKAVVIEGQLHTGGSKQIFERIRLTWWRLFDHVFLYNDAETARLKQKNSFADKNILAMNNGLDQAEIDAAAMQWSVQELLAWRQQQQVEGKTLILSCARLERKNRFDLMIECLPALRVAHPQLLWCVIGAGAELEALQAKADRLGVAAMIRWLGPVYDEDQLAPWFLSSQVLVHPGAVGLSLLHAFGYGLPVITHDNSEEHMPEFAVLEPGLNGEVFRYADLQSMIATIAKSLSTEKGGMTDYALQTVRNRFNTQVMAQRFREMCLQVAEKINSRKLAA
jgi:glycosyltransferase involved in cell wall biosynthesis